MCTGSLFLFFFFLAHFHFPASGQAVVTGVIPSPPRFLPSIFIARRVQQSHCSSIVHRMLLTHALAISASQFVHKKKSQRIYTSMHSAGLELTKLTYTRLEDNLIRHRGDRNHIYFAVKLQSCLLQLLVAKLHTRELSIPRLHAPRMPDWSSHEGLILYCIILWCTFLYALRTVIPDCVLHSGH